jgi:uncharacterized membrane protein YvbJ
MYCQKCGTENTEINQFCGSCGEPLKIPVTQPNVSTKEEQKRIKFKMVEKKAELAGLTNSGAWVLIIVGVLTAIFVVGLILILVGLYIMHTNTKKKEELNREIAKLEAELD